MRVCVCVRAPSFPHSLFLSDHTHLIYVDPESVCVNVATHLSIFCMIDQHRHDQVIRICPDKVIVVMGGRLKQKYSHQLARTPKET